MRRDADEDVERVDLGQDVDGVEAEGLADERGRADAAVAGEGGELGVEGPAAGGDDRLAILVVGYCVGSRASTSSPQPASTMRRRAALSTCPSRP